MISYEKKATLGGRPIFRLNVSPSFTRTIWKRQLSMSKNSFSFFWTGWSINKRSLKKQMLFFLIIKDTAFKLAAKFIPRNEFLYEIKVVDKILMHFWFFDFLHERSFVIDIQIVISIALETKYKLQMKKYN